MLFIYDYLSILMKYRFLNVSINRISNTFMRSRIAFLINSIMAQNLINKSVTLIAIVLHILKIHERIEYFEHVSINK